MAKRPKPGKKSKFRLPPPRPIPQNACWIESDSYDRATYRRLREESPSLQALEEAGGQLLPHFDALLQDLFCLLFKYNTIFFREEDVLPSAALNRLLLQSLHKSDLYAFLRDMTLLDETKAALATVLLGEGALRLLRSEKTLTRRDLLDLWDLSHQEEGVQEKIEEAREAEALSSEEELSREGKKKLEEAASRMASEARGAEAQLRHKARQVGEDLLRVQKELENRFRKEALEVARNLEEASQEAEGWSLLLGGGHRSSPGRQIELGRRLAGNEKLKKLARMVGRMKQQALALRRRVFERRDEEVFEVRQGADLSRLLPHELLALHHPILRKDFARRFVEGELLLYSLRGIEEKGRGPMVVCLDGSSSMMGEKEVWAKAVALTLLEIACRQRRLFRSICFSSADTPLRVWDLNPRELYRPDMEQVLDLAEYFPGGGTDFQKPLDAALECLKKSRYKRGDIVFITDGECQVGAEWKEKFKEAKEALGFSLFSVLIDVGSSSLDTLRELSDRITAVSRLTDEGVRELFLEL